MKQGWEIKKLGDICTIKGRIGFRGYTRNDLVEEGEGAITLSPSNIVNDVINFDKCQYISWYKYDESPEIQIFEGDVIYAKTASIGKVAIIKHLPEKATINPQFVVFKDIKCNHDFLYYAVRGNGFKEQVSLIINGVAIPTISQSNMAKLTIPVPPIAEQEKIVAELDCLSGIIEKKKQQLKELDNLAQSIFYEMFGDPVENDKGWKTSPLHKVSTLINGRAYKQNELLDSGKYRVLRVGNFFTNGNYYYSDLELEDDKYCDNGDLLFAWSASFGAFIWNEDKVIYHYHIWKVLYDNDLLDIQYYRYLLNTMTAFFMKDVHGIGMVHLTKAGMEQYVLPLPPLALQQDFASKIESIEKQKELIAKSIKETETLFNSRMDYYFN